MQIWNRTLALGSIVLSLSVLAACGKDTGTGRLSIALASSGTVASTDAGAQAIGATADSTGPAWDDDDHACPLPQAASVTFSSILARTLDGKLVDVTIDLPVTVDLLALVNGREATLPEGFLPPDTYDQFVVVMTQVELTLASGTKIAITPPGGGWTAVVGVAPPFDVVEGETTTVTLHFRRDRSFGCRLGFWEFHPEFECRHRGS